MAAELHSDTFSIVGSWRGGAASANLTKNKQMHNLSLLLSSPQ